LLLFPRGKSEGNVKQKAGAGQAETCILQTRDSSLRDSHDGGCRALLNAFTPAFHSYELLPFFEKRKAKNIREGKPCGWFPLS